MQIILLFYLDNFSASTNKQLETCQEKKARAFFFPNSVIIQSDFCGIIVGLSLCIYGSLGLIVLLLRGSASLCSLA